MHLCVLCFFSISKRCRRRWARVIVPLFFFFPGSHPANRERSSVRDLLSSCSSCCFFSLFINNNKNRGSLHITRLQPSVSLYILAIRKVLLSAKEPEKCCDSPCASSPWRPVTWNSFCLNKCYWQTISPRCWGLKMKKRALDFFVLFYSPSGRLSQFLCKIPDRWIPEILPWLRRCCCCCCEGRKRTAVQIGLLRRRPAALDLGGPRSWQRRYTSRRRQRGTPLVI